MGREKYIWCSRCGDVHHVTPFDKAPTYAHLGGEMRETASDDWRKFMEKHEGHKLEGLKQAGEKYFPAGSADPMSVGYVQVTNGRDTFLLRRSRKSIEEPLSFELIRGRLAAADMTVDVQENEIKKEMKYHFSWAPAQPPTEEKVELFIRLFKEIVAGLDAERIRISEHAYSLDTLAYGLPDAQIVDQLMTKCAVHFDRDQLAGLRRFVEAHLGGSDVMTLVLKRQYNIEQTAW